MTISELVAELERVRASHGDVPVVLRADWPHAEKGCGPGLGGEVPNMASEVEVARPLGGAVVLGMRRR